MALIIKTPESKIPFTDKEIADNGLSVDEADLATLIYIEASEATLRQIIRDFTPTGMVAPAYCSLTIPVSNLNLQRWYGDTAKTIVYALLQ